MQRSITAGDSLKFTVSLSDYPASAGWVLSYRLIPRAAGAVITFAAGASGDDHLVALNAAATASWAAGDYTSAAFVALGADRFTIDSESSQVTIRPNLGTVSTPIDLRSQAEIALAAVRAKLGGKATDAVESYRINDRELRFYSLTELVRLEQKLASDVAREQLAAGITPDRPGNTVRRIFVRMP
jgi:hypothetical protein